MQHCLDGRVWQQQRLHWVEPLTVASRDSNWLPLAHGVTEYPGWSSARLTFLQTHSICRQLKAFFLCPSLLSKLWQCVQHHLCHTVWD